MVIGMKKFLLKAIIPVSIILLVIACNIIVDPYNIFHSDNVRANGVEPNRNYVKTKHVIDNSDMYDSYVIGASRCGYMDVERIDNGTYYNLTYGGGNMYEFLLTLEVLLDNDVKIKNILLGLDEGSYTYRYMHDNAAGAIPYPGKSIKEKSNFYAKYYLDTFTTIRSIPIMLNVSDREANAYIANIYTTGSWCEKETVLSKETDVYESINYERSISDGDKECIEDAIEDLNIFVKICNEEGIELTIYTHPLHIKNYGDVISYGYLDFIEKLAENVEFYNFSGMNDVTAEYDNYYEWSHYTYEVTDKLIDIMYYDKLDKDLLKQGFGYYVTADNKDDFLRILYSQLEERTYEE